MILNSDNVLDFIPSGLQQFGKKAQVGIDLSIKNITKIVGGKLFQNGKKNIKEYKNVSFYINDEGIKTWKLNKGVYSLTFDQTVQLDTKHCGKIVNKSTILRIGGFITSGVYDPGFKSSDEGCGATLFVFEDNSIEIEKGSCLVQLVIEECEEAESYSEKGSYQHNKDLL